MPTFIPDAYRGAVPLDEDAEPVFAALVAAWDAPAVEAPAEPDTTVIPLRAVAASA